MIPAQKVKKMTNARLIFKVKNKNLNSTTSIFWIVKITIIHPTTMRKIHFQLICALFRLYHLSAFIQNILSLFFSARIILTLVAIRFISDN